LPLLPGSVVNSTLFFEFGRKNRDSSHNVCSSRSIFANATSALDRFQLVNLMEYLIRPLWDEGGIRESKNRPVLRAGKFAGLPEESVPERAQGQALPFRGETGPLKSRD
jgi:hypothetical protein